MRVAFHPRAAEDAARIDTWWKTNRLAAPTLFREELEETLTAVTITPTLGASGADDEFPDVRRAVMKRTRYLLYYRVEGDMVVVLAIWHSARGEGPTFP